MKRFDDRDKCRQFLRNPNAVNRLLTVNITESVNGEIKNNFAANW